MPSDTSDDDADVESVLARFREQAAGDVPEEDIDGSGDGER